MVFRVFKQEVNRGISTVASGRHNDSIDVYQLCALLRYAFYRPFTHSNIVQSFSRAGLWPIDHKRLLSVPRAKNNDDQIILLSMSDMEQILIEEKERARRVIFGDAAVV